MQEEAHVGDAELRDFGDLLVREIVLKLEADDLALTNGGQRVVDIAFIEQHTAGFEEFAAFCRAQAWDQIERASGLSRADMLDAAIKDC